MNNRRSWLPKGAESGMISLPSGEIFRVVMRPQAAQSEHTPTLLLHGFGANTVTWCDVQPLLSARRITHAIDLPGMGFSFLPAGGVGVEHYVTAVAEYLDRENLHGCDIVGHSLGGAVAALFALEYPERVRKIALIAPLLMFERIQKGVVGTMLRTVATPGSAHLLLPFYGRWFTKMFLKKITHRKECLRDELITGYYEPAKSKGFLQAIYYLNRLLYDPAQRDLVARLPQMDKDCLILWGDDDVLLPVEDLEPIRQRIPHARCVTLADCGHMMVHEDPQWVVAELEKFLGKD